MSSRKLTISKCDEYYTPDKIWEDIEQYLPKGKIIFEPFYGQGHTFKYFKINDYLVLGKKDLDFFSPDAIPPLMRCDCVISNPPFTLKFKILKRLVQYDKPFILLFPLGSINTKSFLDCFDDNIKHISLIFPKGRMQFITNGSLAKSPSFESVYLCYKMLDDKLVFLK